MTHTEYGIEMYVDAPDEHWLTLETGALTLSYAQAAREMYQEEFPSKTVRIVKKTSTFEVVDEAGTREATSPILGPQELAVTLHHSEADALLALLEQALNAGMEPGIGLRRDDAHAAGVKLELARQGVAL